MFKLGIIVASDSTSRGENIDKSGKLIESIMEQNGYKTEVYSVLPDEIEIIKNELINFCDNLKLDLILTTGGTGFSIRDITPEATIQVCEKMAYGIAEAMRAASMKITPKAMLSRAVAGIRGSTLIINLPGSQKAVRENLDVILPALKHGLEILKGSASDCGSR